MTLSSIVERSHKYGQFSIVYTMAIEDTKDLLVAQEGRTGSWGRLKGVDNVDDDRTDVWDE